jgi:hypothetical protein
MDGMNHSERELATAAAEWQKLNLDAQAAIAKPVNAQSAYDPEPDYAIIRAADALEGIEDRFHDLNSALAIERKERETADTENTAYTRKVDAENREYTREMDKKNYKLALAGVVLGALSFIVSVIALLVSLGCFNSPVKLP